jgi:hypothetical protein
MCMLQTVGPRNFAITQIYCLTPYTLLFTGCLTKDLRGRKVARSWATRVNIKYDPGVLGPSRVFIIYSLRAPGMLKLVYEGTFTFGILCRR